MSTLQQNGFERTVEKGGELFAKLTYGSLETVSELLKATAETVVGGIMLGPDTASQRIQVMQKRLGDIWSK